MPEHYVQRFLDHANLSTTSRYGHDTPRDAPSVQAIRAAAGGENWKKLQVRCKKGGIYRIFRGSVVHRREP